MKTKTIATGSVDHWLQRLSSQAEVLVPTRNAAGDVVLAPRRGPAEMSFRRLHESPKRVLLPQTDDLVDFEGGKARAKMDRTQRVLFALRPCDCQAIAALDAVFGRDVADPHYKARRERMGLIVVACRESEDTCFCAATGSGPVARDGFDVQLVPAGDVYLVVIGSETGRQLVEAGGELFAEGPDDVLETIETCRRRAMETQPARPDLHRAQKLLGQVAPEFWQKLADACLTCGGCAYVCPTCTCYNIADRPVAEHTGVRQRLWDSCVLEGFFREASGHNPYGAQSSRCLRRYVHKLGGSDVSGQSFRCVGCGRCIAACISGLGMIRVVQELLESEVSRTTAPKVAP